MPDRISTCFHLAGNGTCKESKSRGFTSLAPQVVVMKRAAWDTALAIAFFLCAALYQLYKTC